MKASILLASLCILSTSFAQDSGESQTSGRVIPNINIEVCKDSRQKFASFNVENSAMNLALELAPNETSRSSNKITNVQNVSESELRDWRRFYNMMISEGETYTSAENVVTVLSDKAGEKHLFFSSSIGRMFLGSTSECK